MDRNMDKWRQDFGSRRQVDDGGKPCAEFMMMMILSFVLQILFSKSPVELFVWNAFQRSINPTFMNKCCETHSVPSETLSSLSSLFIHVPFTQKGERRLV